MVAIRLARTGAKKKPTYRVVVTDKRRPQVSQTLEIVGHYNPRLDPIELNLVRDRIGYWIGVGAQPSETVKRLIKRFDEKGPSLVEPKRKAMQEAAAAVKPTPKPEPKAEAKAEPKPAAAEAKAEEAPAAAAPQEAAPAAEAAESKPETEESA